MKAQCLFRVIVVILAGRGFVTAANADPPPLPKKAEDILKVYEEMLPKTKLPEALKKLKSSVLGVLDGEIAAEFAKDRKSTVLQTLLQKRMEIAPLDLLKINANALQAEPEGVKLRPGMSLATPCLLSPPIKLEATVKATKGNLRLMGGADQIIFGWEANPAELRIDGGPASGQHVAKQGRIPANTFFKVEQEIYSTTMVVKIDGRERATWTGDFSKISGLSGMFAAVNTQLTVKECKVTGKVTGMPK
jgi:hypothetical protein